MELDKKDIQLLEILEKNSKSWEIWQNNLRETLKGGDIFGSEQLAMKISVYQDNIETEFFLDRRLKDISKISSLKRPLSDMKKFANNFNGLKNTINIKSAFSFLKKINNIKNSSIS